MATPIEAKEKLLRSFLTDDNTWTPFDALDAVPQGWTFLEHPDGGFAAWRKPPHWALHQPSDDRIRLRTRGGLYKL
jgi:hypothetical protein